MYPPVSRQPDSDSVVVIYDAPGTQLDFQSQESPIAFLEQDCVTYPEDSPTVGVKLCLAKNTEIKGAIDAGISLPHFPQSTTDSPAIFACTAGTHSSSCLTNPAKPIPNVSTILTVYNLHTTTVCSPTNNSILALYDLSTPVIDTNLNITALKRAFGWLLNYPAADIPPMSSLAFWFWFAPSEVYNDIWRENTYLSLRSALAFIIWEFSTNNNANPSVAIETNGGTPALPEMFRRIASVSRGYVRFVLNWWAFIMYVVLESVALAFCWIVLAWCWMSGGWEVGASSYPLIDFAGKLGVSRHDGGENESTTLRGWVDGGNDDKSIRLSLRDVRVVVLD
jgi:hypothetical protein